MFSVTVEKDSYYEIDGIYSRATSFIIEAPRFILAQIVTHRSNSNNDDSLEISWSENTTTKDISKNSGSSRAIPFNRMLDKVRNDLFDPIWTLNQKGMHGENLKDANIIHQANEIWSSARDAMCFYAKKLSDIGIHKQDCNRLLEPFSWTKQILTSSNWDNFFALRCSNNVQPEFRLIARLMYLARLKSTPKKLIYGRWHLPFTSEDETKDFFWIPDETKELPWQIKFSIARSAWVSYHNHDKKGTTEDLLKTYNLLLKEIPVHASPAEHQITPLSLPLGKFTSNIKNWVQARKLLQYENISNYQPSKEELSTWEDVIPYT